MFSCGFDGANYCNVGAKRVISSCWRQEAELYTRTFVQSVRLGQVAVSMMVTADLSVSWVTVLYGKRVREKKRGKGSSDSTACYTTVRKPENVLFWRFPDGAPSSLWLRLAAGKLEFWEVKTLGWRDVDCWEYAAEDRGWMWAVFKA
jgi:hypothetical protein